MKQFMAPGAYINYLEDDADAQARQVYGPNHRRLVQVKNKYDPQNFLRWNANILPGQPASG